MRHFRVMTFSISLHWGHLCHVDTFLVLKTPYVVYDDVVYCFGLKYKVDSRYVSCTCDINKSKTAPDVLLNITHLHCCFAKILPSLFHQVLFLVLFCSVIKFQTKQSGYGATANGGPSSDSLTRNPLYSRQTDDKTPLLDNLDDLVQSASQANATSHHVHDVGRLPDNAKTPKKRSKYNPG